MSSVRDPIAVEPRRHPVRQMHDSLRRSHKIVGVQDDEIGRLVIPVYDEADQPAVVLGPFGAARHEDELAGVAAGAEIAWPGGSVFEIVTKPAGMREISAERRVG